MAPALVGALVYLLMRDEHRVYTYVKKRSAKALVAAFGVMCVCVVSLASGIKEGGFAYHVNECIGRTTFSLAVGVLVMTVTSVSNSESAFPSGFASRIRVFLSGRVFRVLGRMSYAVYLVHVYVLKFSWRLPPRMERLGSGVLLVEGFKLYFLSLVFAVPICVGEELMFMGARLMRKWLWREKVGQIGEKKKVM